MNSPISQQYHYAIVSKYKELVQSYADLRKETQKIYENNINNDDYSVKLANHVDTTAIEKEHFIYENNKEEQISKLLHTRLYKINENKVIKLFELRQKKLTKKTEKISLDNLGTNLNVLREFYNDVHVELQRNMKKETTIQLNIADNITKNTEKYVFDVKNNSKTREESIPATNMTIKF